MILSQETINILENFAEINNCLAFSAGNVIETMNYPAQTQFAKAVVAENFPQEFAIADLKRFLSALSVFEQPDLDFKKNWVEISENSKSLQYIYADEAIVHKARSINMPPADVDFVLKADSLKEVLKVRNVLSLPNVVFTGDGKEIKFGTENPANPTTDKYYTTIGETSEQFKIVFKIDNLKLIPGDYEVKLSKGMISEFSRKNIKYWSAIEATSDFGE